MILFPLMKCYKNSVLKYLFCTHFALLSILFASAQTEAPQPPPPDVDTTRAHEAIGNNSIMEFVAEMAVYKGGDAALYAFISKNIIYPFDEMENEIEGVVYVQFVVEKDGTTSAHKILRGVNGGPGLGKEAIRVAKLIQFEKPGMQNNAPVRTLFTLPIRFALD